MGTPEPTEDHIASLRADFAAIGCAQLHDAAPDLVSIVRLPLVARTPLSRVCGPVFPVYTDDDMLPCLQALAATPPGWVLYLCNRTVPSEALAGDIFTASARVQRLGGIVVDGAVRDVDQLAPLGVPVFSTAVTFASARTTATPAASVPQTVVSGGVTIRPGDWILADTDGCMVVAAESLSAVMAAGAVLRRRERQLIEAMDDRGATLAELTGLDDFLAGRGPLTFNP
jgi:4-hydroxy-4-methyl-2-oxoglutarate aldolase